MVRIIMCKFGENSSPIKERFMGNLLLRTLVLSFCFVGSLSAQTAPDTEYVRINGEWVKALIDGCDTFFIMQLEEVTYTEPRTFKNVEDRRKYHRYKNYALKVYPYAQEAIKIFKETNYLTRNMSKRARKKHINRLQKELKQEFTEPLKNLSKTQGLILQKMIERETKEPLYDSLKTLRNGWTARYWHTFGSFWGYDLKKGYIRGEDQILDIILDDLNASYELPEAAAE